MQRTNQDPLDEILSKAKEEMGAFATKTKEEIINFYKNLPVRVSEEKRLTKKQKSIMSIFNANINNALSNFYEKIKASRAQQAEILKHAKQSAIELMRNYNIPKELCLDKLKSFSMAARQTANELTCEIKEALKKCHAEHNRYLLEGDFLTENQFLTALGYDTEQITHLLIGEEE